MLKKINNVIASEERAKQSLLFESDYFGRISTFINKEIASCDSYRNITARIAYRSFALTIVILSLLFVSSCKSQKETAATGEPGLQKSEFLKGNIDNVAIEQIYIDASKAKLLEDYPSAIEGYKKVVKLDPTNHAAYYELAVLYYGAGENEVAKQYISNAVKHNPSNKWYLILHAEILTRLNQFVEAGKVYEAIIKNHPEEYEFYYNWAFALMRANKLEESIKIYDRLEEKVGIDEELIMQKQKLYIAINKFDKAVAEVQKLLNSDPTEPRYYQMLAEMYQANNMNEKADEVYQKLLQIDPKSPYAQLNLADNAKKKGDRELYMKYMKEVFANNQLNIDVKIRILFPYLNAFQKNDSIQKQEAYTLSKIMTEAHPTEAKAFAMYADFLFQEDRDTAALTQYNNALALDKSVFEVWQQVFFIYSDLKHYNDLIRVTDEAMDIFPNKPISYFFNGLAKSQLKKYREATEILESGKMLVVKNDPLKVQFLSSLGDAYNNMKEYGKSDSSFEAALGIDPNNAYVLNNYSYYLSLRNHNLDKAKKMSAKSLDLEPDNDSFLDTYGWILYMLGDYAEAKKYIEKSIEKGSAKSAVVVEHYGDVLFRLGEIDDAVQQWMKAKELGSDSELIGRKIADKQLYE
jgi:tetratricopeptide (TPR) repeat protein